MSWSGAGWSAAPVVRMEEILACSAMTDDAQRLACYDEHVKPLSQAATLPVPAPADNFGVAGSELARRQAEEKKKVQQPVEPLVATVKELSSASSGELIFTLSNDQVWRQKKAGPYFPVKVGDPVRIEAGLLGSYRLALPSGRASQVTRVR
ncbi:MAG: hypothetical protein ABW106_13705 [Steroidobacteraceae bacterium]